MIDIFSGNVYAFGSYDSAIRVIVRYEKQRDGANMKYRFYYKVYLTGKYASTAYYQNNVRGTFTLNGKNVWTVNTKNSGKGWSNEYTSDWFTIENKIDGTVPFKFTIKDTINSSWCNYTSSTFQLEISPAGSDFNTVSNFNIGQPFTVTTNKYNSEFYDKLVIKIGSTVIKTINNVNSSISVDFNSNELNVIYELTSKVQNIDFTFEISSYDNEEMTNQIGITNTKVSKGYIIASNPIISSKSGIDSNSITVSLTGDNTKLVKGYSNAKITISAKGQNSATIKSITVNNQIVTNGVITFNKTITNVFNIVVTDSRDFQTTANITLDMVNYIELSISPTVVRNQPTDGKVKINYSGNYYKGNFGKVSNTLKVQYRLKEKGLTFSDSDVWKDMTPTINNNNTFSQTNFLVSNVDYQKVYEFQVRAIDELNVRQVNGIIVPKGKPVFWWEENEFYVKDEAISSFITNLRNRIAGYGDQCKNVDGDWNTACGNASGFYMGDNLANSPDLSMSAWYLVVHLVHNANYKSQLAFGFQKHCVYVRNQTGGTWNEWKQITHEDNTLSIVESVINENNSYIKYSDGTMVCKGLISSYVEGGHQTLKEGWYISSRVIVNFPKTFIESPHVYVTAYRTAADTTGIQMFVGSVTESSFATWSGLLVKSSATGWNRKYIAIGRWK